MTFSDRPHENFSQRISISFCLGRSAAVRIINWGYLSKVAQGTNDSFKIRCLQRTEDPLCTGDLREIRLLEKLAINKKFRSAGNAEAIPQK